jgi:polyhydroxyalkanoate synthesis repressor PhaR
MNSIRTIKRYSNRKLYDTELHRYLKLAELRGLVREGKEWQAVDAVTGADITSTILAEIVHDEERQLFEAGQPSRLGIAALVHIVRKGIPEDHAD